jgi:site-specific recombinase
VFILIQTQSQIPDWSNQAEHLTLTGAMVIAIAVLWRSLQTERSLHVQSIKTMSDALLTSASSNVELRKVIEESVSAKRQMTESLKLMMEAFNMLRSEITYEGPRRRAIDDSH